MPEYNIEISGSKTVSHDVDCLVELKRIAKRAQGRVSVVRKTSQREVYHGTPDGLLFEIEEAEQRGMNL